MAVQSATDAVQHSRPLAVGLILTHLSKVVASDASHQEHVLGLLQASTVARSQVLLKPSIFAGVKGKEQELARLRRLSALVLAKRRSEQLTEEELSCLVGECAREENGFRGARADHGLKQQLERSAGFEDGLHGIEVRQR